MTGKTHVLCGTTTMLALTVMNPSGLSIGGHSYLPILGLISVASGSLAPDIDMPQSKVGRKAKFISKRLKHRGITHTLVVPIFLYLLMTSVASIGVVGIPELLMGFLVGWVTHIVADAFNAKGVPILRPFSSTNFHIGSVLTGSWQEKVFLFLWMGGHLAWVLSQF